MSMEDRRNPDYQRSYLAGQRRLDAQEPPEDWNCDKDGGHQWRKLRVARIKGVDVVEYKCRVCGETKVE